MRTDPPPADGDATGAALSRRAFVVAGGAAAGTVVGSGLAAADDDAPVVGATQPYVPAARGAADAAESSVSVRSVRELDASPDVLVSGRPEAVDGGHPVQEVEVDGAAALTNEGGTWRDVLPRSAVRDRWTADGTVETWSEYDGAVADGLESVARPANVAGEASTLVRGTRAYQYAAGRGGVGYYDVDRAAITDAADGTDGDGTVPVVRLGYVHAASDTVDDERIAAFLDSYGGSSGDADAASNAFVDPAVR